METPVTVQGVRGAAHQNGLPGPESDWNQQTETLEHLLRWPPEGAADAEMAESTLLLGGADGR